MYRDRIGKAARIGMATLLLASVWFAGGCRAQQPWPLWEHYTARFLDPQGRILDRSAQDRTTSEGQAYALFFALVDNDRAHFDKILNWTEVNMAGGDLTLRLPAWNWGKADDGSWKILDTNPASDANLWMAYTLMEAGRLWHNTRYANLGEVMAARIAHTEVVFVPGAGTVLIPGPQGFHPDPNTWLLNPSYEPPFILRYLSENAPPGPWRSMLDAQPDLLRHAAPAGFVMDWVSAASSITPSPTPTELAQGKKDAVPVGSYDAIRVYLWLGMSDDATPGWHPMVNSLASMAAYMKGQVTPPLQVDAAGKAINPEGTIGFSAAIVPFLQASHMKNEAKLQADRLQATLDPTSGLYGHNGDYYDQNLALFATGWQEQRFHFERDGRLKLKWK